MEYSKERLVQNIRHLLNVRQLKLSNLDAAIGKSSGYATKIFSEENASNPSIDAVYGVSKFLQTSLDSLVDSKYGEMSENDLFLDHFLDKVLKKTIEGKLLWNRNVLKDFLDLKNQSVDVPFIYEQSIQEVRDSESGDPYDSYCVDVSYSFYKSKAFPEWRICMKGDAFSVLLNDKNNATLFLTHVEDFDGGCACKEDLEKLKSWYEMFVVQGNEINLLLCTLINDKAPSLNERLKELYNTVLESFSQIQISPSVKTLLEEFLEST